MTVHLIDEVPAHLNVATTPRHCAEADSVTDVPCGLAEDATSQEAPSVTFVPAPC